MRVGYPQYKDSAAEWLGVVPDHWSVRRLGLFFSERRERVSDKDYQPLSVTKNGIVPQLETAAKTDDGDNRKKVALGDFVINSRSDRKGSSGLASQDGSVSLINTVLVPRNIEPRFVHHLLRSVPFQEEFYRYGTGIVADLWSTNYSEMKTIVLAVPPPAEQAAIAAFLDRETAKIDALVDQQRRLIGLLKEKRQAVISHAVTKGIDPDAPMKDSGIEWLGMVPAHWETRRIKTVIRTIEQGWSPQCDGMPVASADEWGVLKVGCVNEGIFNPTENKTFPSDLSPKPELSLRKGDLLVSRANTRDLVGRAAVVEDEYPRLMLSDKLYRLRVDADCLPGFLAYFLGTGFAREQIELEATGASSSMLNIAQSTILELAIPVPPISEQTAVVTSLQRSNRQFGELEAVASQAISLLQERRSALISAAVTGKIDVHDAATPRVRLIAAATIVDKLAHKPTFGRVKLQKLAYMTEVHAGLRELQGQYIREAAGPLDRAMIAEMETQLERNGHAVVEQPDGRGGQVTYLVRGRKGAYRKELISLLGDRQAEFDRMLAELGDLETKSVEAIATLYAVWNDALLDGQAPSDDAIVTAVREEWHPEKEKKFTKAELREWLGWMRRNRFVPWGTQPRTQLGRLFP